MILSEFCRIVYKLVSLLYPLDARGLQRETNLWEIMDWDLLMWSDLTLGPSFKVKQGSPNLKVLITYYKLIIGPRGLQCETNL